MKCLNCGQEIPDASEYCCYCGNKVTPIIDEEQALNNSDIDNTDECCQDKASVSYKEPVISVGGLFGFKGRRSRKPYFLVVFTLNFFMVGIKSLVSARTIIPIESIIVVFLVMAIVLYIHTTNLAKRLQDINIPGSVSIAWTLIVVASFLLFGSTSIIKALDFMIVLIVLFKSGTVGPNNYGPDPLNRQ